MQLSCDVHGSYLKNSGNNACPQCNHEQLIAHEHQQTMERHRQRWTEGKTHSLKELIGHSGIPPKYVPMGFRAYNATNDGQMKALQTAQHYAENIDERMKDGKGLMFVGSPGTGKTHLACAIGRVALSAGYSALFITVLDMTERVKEGYGNDSQESVRSIKRRFMDIELLILDEIGVQLCTPAEQVILTDIINKRYENLKPTIMLSNLHVKNPAVEKDMYGVLGDRIMDRMRELNSLVTFNWESHRGTH